MQLKDNMYLQAVKCYETFLSVKCVNLLKSIGYVMHQQV